MRPVITNNECDRWWYDTSLAIVNTIARDNDHERGGYFWMLLFWKHHIWWMLCVSVFYKMTNDINFVLMYWQPYGTVSSILLHCSVTVTFIRHLAPACFAIEIRDDFTFSKTNHHEWHTRLFTHKWKIEWSTSFKPMLLIAQNRTYFVNRLDKYKLFYLSFSGFLNTECLEVTFRLQELCHKRKSYSPETYFLHSCKCFHCCTNNIISDSSPDLMSDLLFTSAFDKWAQCNDVGNRKQMQEA